MKEYQKLIETNEFPNNTHLRVSVFYDKGGMNYYNGTVNRRGFYVSVTLVKKSNQCISSILGSGIKELLSETKRYSDKQFHLSVEMSIPRISELIAALKMEQKMA